MDTVLQPWHIAGLVLLAVLVGAALPVLISLRSTLREARQFLLTVGKSTERSLHELTVTLEKVNRSYADSEARAAAARSHPHASDGAMAGVAAAVGALAAPALLEWLMAMVANRKAEGMTNGSEPRAQDRDARAD